MKIDKIKNYNQTLLAVLSTLGCLLLLIIIIIMIMDMIPSNDYTEKPTGLIANDEVETLHQENLRKQIISYETPWLIDTLRSTYIVPVSIRTLKKPEEVREEEGVLGLITAPSLRFNKGGGYYQHNHFEGKYANLIIYSPKTEKVKSLFDKRLIIGNINTFYFKDDILLIFYIASEDTDKNGVIDLEDLRRLCIYSMNTDKMKIISDGDNQIEKYKFVEDSKDLLIGYSLSLYSKDRFDDDNAPSKVMRYNYETEELVNIIPQEIQEEMQKLVEGKK